NMSVAENIFARREITRGILGIDHKAQVQKANAFLKRLDAGIETLQKRIGLLNLRLVIDTEDAARDFAPCEDILGDRHV
ncbi:hypothetical protein ELI02_36195, partial [Rhizobium leguminosarum]